MKIYMCLAVLVGALGLFGTGCGNSDPTPVAQTPQDLASFITPGPVLDLSQVCVPSCTEDTDCQNSCPAVITGANCCHVATATCFVATTTTCPVPVTPDMAQSTSMY